MEQLVARWAHNPKVVSSSLAPATKKRNSKYEFLFLFLYVYSWEIVNQDETISKTLNGLFLYYKNQLLQCYYYMSGITPT